MPKKPKPLEEERPEMPQFKGAPQDIKYPEGEAPALEGAEREEDEEFAAEELSPEGEKLAPEEEFAPEVPTGEDIKEAVGYPEEESPFQQEVSTPLPQEAAAPSQQEAAAPFPQEEEPPIPLPPEEGPPTEQPPFLPPPEPAPQEMQQIIASAMDGVKQEFENKIKILEQEIDELRRLDNEIKNIAKTLEKIEKKYEEMEEKTMAGGADVEEIKENVNTTNELLSAGLPALIKEIRESKKA